MLCEKCGSESPASNYYCGKCGTTLPTSDSEPTYAPRSLTLRREITVLALGLLLVAGAAFGAWYAMFYQRSPVMVVRRFVDADLQNQLAKQPQLLVDRWDSKMVLSAFQVVRQQTGRSPFKNYRIIGSTENGNTAYVNVELTFTIPAVPGVNQPLNAAAPPTPTSVPFAFVLVSQNGEWKIDGSQTLVNAAGALVAAGYTQLAPFMNGIPNINLPNVTLPNLGLPGGAPPVSVPVPSPGGSVTL